MLFEVSDLQKKGETIYNGFSAKTYALSVSNMGFTNYWIANERGLHLYAHEKVIGSGIISGLEELGAVSVVPNPSAGIFTLSSNVALGAARYQVQDTAGKVVAQGSLDGYPSGIQLDFSGWPPGPYQIILQFPGGFHLAERLVIIR